LNCTNKEVSELIHENFLEDSRARGEIYPCPGDFSPRGFWGQTEQSSESGGKGYENSTAGVGSLQLLAVPGVGVSAGARKVAEFAKKRAIPAGMALEYR